MHAARVVFLQCTVLFQELNYPVQLRLRKDAQGKCALSVAVHKGRSAVVDTLMRTRTHGRPRTARAAALGVLNASEPVAKSWTRGRHTLPKAGGPFEKSSLTSPNPRSEHQAPSSVLCASGRESRETTT